MPMDRTDIIIVGAGAAGLTAAIQAARAGSSVLVLEHMGQAGKKILSTGNGKCNFTNKKQGIAYYRGEDPAFVLPALQQFGLADTLCFFEGLGISPKEKRGGYYYPASGQASSVAEVLLMECRRLKVRILYGIGIQSIQKKQGVFEFKTKQGMYWSDACILATGGKSAKKTGSDGSGNLYAKGFGHTITPLAPALVQLQGKHRLLKEMAGVRVDGRIRLLLDGDRVAEESGELQLTEFGVSGIPAFQVSRFAAYALLEGKTVAAALDFLPGSTEKQAEGCMFQRFFQKGEGKSAKEALVGLFPEKLGLALLKEAGICPQDPARGCAKAKVRRLARVAQRFEIRIVGTKGFDAAQVTAGGVRTAEICPETMESKRIPRLYFAGEIIDVDGMCGGYNLQWAWSSGSVAGRSAACSGTDW